jgi:hypothetical protein
MQIVNFLENAVINVPSGGELALHGGKALENRLR